MSLLNALRVGAATCAILAATSASAIDGFDRPSSPEQENDLTMLVDLAVTSMFEGADRLEFLRHAWERGIAIEQYHEPPYVYLDEEYGDVDDDMDAGAWYLTSHQPTGTLRNLYTMFWDRNAISYLKFELDYTKANWDHAIALLTGGMVDFDEDMTIPYSLWAGGLAMDDYELSAMISVVGYEDVAYASQGAYRPGDELMRISISYIVHGCSCR